MFYSLWLQLQSLSLTNYHVNMTNLTSDLKEYLSRNDASKNEASSSISLKTFGKFFNKNETVDNEVLLDGSHKYFQSDCCPTLVRNVTSN